MRGKVKFYSADRGFGFIVPDSGEADIYFNESSLLRDRTFDPVEGDQVEFDVREVAKGKLAHKITPIEAKQAAE